MPNAIVLAIHAEHANAIRNGTARTEHAPFRRRGLPAQTCPAVVEQHAVKGECELSPPTRRSDRGWPYRSGSRAATGRRDRSEYDLMQIRRSRRHAER